MEIIDDLYWFEENHVHENGDGYGCENIIMQSTGLHDKNGKEIYEGDILKSEFVECNFEIEWNNEAACYDWCVVAETKKMAASLAKAIEEAPAKAKKPFDKIIEVIGNIYENPELLK